MVRHVTYEGADPSLIQRLLSIPELAKRTGIGTHFRGRQSCFRLVYIHHR